MSESQSLSQQVISLLLHCQQLQSEKDGIKRPLPFQAGVQADEELDEFARQLERENKITVTARESYADAPLAWLVQQCAAGQSS